jgi:quinol monooxygenase YgiN
MATSKKIITATIVVKTEHVADFIETAKSMVENSNAEPGCESYMFYQDPFNKTRFIAVEFWKDQAAIDSHNNSAHFKAFIAKTSKWQTVPAEVKVLDVVSK